MPTPPTSSTRHDKVYIAPKRFARRVSLSGNTLLASAPRLTRRISRSLSLTSAKTLEWLNVRTEQQGCEVLDKPNQTRDLPSRKTRRNSFTSLISSSSATDGNSPISRKVCNSNLYEITTLPRRRSEGGLHHHIQLSQPTGLLNYPVRCDPIERVAPSIPYHTRPKPARPPRPTEEVDLTIANMQHEIYGIQAPQRNMFADAPMRQSRQTRNVAADTEGMARTIYVSNAISTEVRREQANEDTYIGLTMDVDIGGNVVGKRHCDSQADLSRQHHY